MRESNVPPVHGRVPPRTLGTYRAPPTRPWSTHRVLPRTLSTESSPARRHDAVDASFSLKGFSLPRQRLFVNAPPREGKTKKLNKNPTPEGFLGKSMVGPRQRESLKVQVLYYCQASVLSTIFGLIGSSSLKSASPASEAYRQQRSAS